MATLPTGYGDYRDPTDTAAWEHAVEMLTRDPLAWVCPDPDCSMPGEVDGGPHAGTAIDDRDIEVKAEVGMAADGSPVWEFACPGCGTLLNVDEEGTR